MQRNKKRKSGGHIILRLAVLAFSVYAIVTLVGLQRQLAVNRQQLSQVKTQVAQQQEQNDAMQSLLNNGATKDFIEQAARDKLGWAYPDEQIYVIPGAN